MKQKLSIIAELFEFLAANKKWWLIPILVVLLSVAGLLVYFQSTAIAPFIYVLF